MERQVKGLTHTERQKYGNYRTNNRFLRHRNVVSDIHADFTQKDAHTLKQVQDICWLTHYLILGCGSAAAASFLCVSRSSVFYLCDKKGVTSRIPLYIYIVLYAISAVLTWKSIFSIFPALASIFSAVAFWCGNHIKTKLLTFCASSSTLVYTIAVSHSAAVYAGLARDGFIVGFIPRANSKSQEKA